MTNKGLRAELFLIPFDRNQEIFYAALECLIGNSLEHTPGIYVRRVSGSEKLENTSSTNQFARILADRLEILNADEKAIGNYPFAGEFWELRHIPVGSVLVT